MTTTAETRRKKSVGTFHTKVVGLSVIDDTVQDNDLESFATRSMSPAGRRRELWT